MNTDEKRIPLKVNRQDFEDIYFTGNQKSLFLSPSTKGKTVTTLVVAAILIVLIIFRNDLSKEKFGIIYFVSFLFLLCAVYLSLAINKVSKWRKEVSVYLKKLESAKVYEIVFDRDSFGVNLDGQSEFSLWKDFNAAEINDRYIALEGKFNYMFPRKAMSPADFSVLKKAVEKNILNG